MKSRWKVTTRAPKGRDGRYWQLRITSPDGKRTQKSSGQETEEAAWAAARVEEAKLNLGVECVTLSDVMERHLAARTIDGNTARRTLERIDLVRRTIASRLPGVTKAEILKLRDTLLAEGLSPATVNQRLCTAGAAWNWAHERDLVAQPWPKFKSLRGTRTKKRPYKPEEIVALLAAAKTHGHPRGWIYPTVLFLYETGARAGETLQVRERDVNRETGAVLLRFTKSRSVRTVHVSDEILSLVPPRDDPDAHVFLSARGAPLERRSWSAHFIRLKAAAGLQGLPLDAHSLRRTWIVDAIRAGVPMTTSMKAVGHVSEAVHLLYTKNADGEDVRAASAVVNAFRAPTETPTDGGGRSV